MRKDRGMTNDFIFGICIGTCLGALFFLAFIFPKMHRPVVINQCPGFHCSEYNLYHPGTKVDECIAMRKGGW